MKDQDMKENLLMGSKMFLDEALNQHLKLEAVKVATSPPEKLQEGLESL
jgi:hypothetical protein